MSQHNCKVKPILETREELELSRKVASDLLSDLLSWLRRDPEAEADDLSITLYGDVPTDLVAELESWKGSQI